MTAFPLTYSRWVAHELPRIPNLKQDPLDFVFAQGLVLKNSESDKRLLYLEFGVFQGRTAMQIAGYLPAHDSERSKAVIHGFDSFEGLPEDWSIGVAGDEDNLDRRIMSGKTFDL